MLDVGVKGDPIKRFNELGEWSVKMMLSGDSPISFIGSPGEDIISILLLWPGLCL